MDNLWKHVKIKYKSNNKGPIVYLKGGKKKVLIALVCGRPKNLKTYFIYFTILFYNSLNILVSILHTT